MKSGNYEIKKLRYLFSKIKSIPGTYNEIFLKIQTNGIFKNSSFVKYLVTL